MPFLPRRLRKVLRKVLPRKIHPLLDGPIAEVPNDRRFEEAYLAEIPGSFQAGDEAFVRARYVEGLRLRAILREYLDIGGGTRVLDVGGGNGAIELVMSAAGAVAVSVELLWNDTAHRVHRSLRIPFRRALADANRLPFPPSTFGAVTCIETIEHLREPRMVAAEIMRVLQPGGILLITTPPRLRYLVRPDPHFGIKGLLLLPAALQRRIAQRRGFGELYHVERIFLSVGQIRALFPRHELVTILSRSRAPRRFFWDAILLRKPQPT